MQDQKITSSKKSTKAEFKILAIKLIILIAIARISIALIEIFFASDLGLKYNHILVGDMMITVIVSFIVITSIRRVLQRIPAKIPAHLVASISFFSIIMISLIASLMLLYIWGVQLQTILVGGGVAAIVVGLGVSTIVGKHTFRSYYANYISCKDWRFNFYSR